MTIETEWRDYDVIVHQTPGEVMRSTFRDEVSRFF